jgi:hypothetical protein
MPKYSKSKDYIKNSNGRGVGCGHAGCSFKTNYEAALKDHWLKKHSPTALIVAGQENRLPGTRTRWTTLAPPDDEAD